MVISWTGCPWVPWIWAWAPSWKSPASIGPAAACCSPMPWWRFRRSRRRSSISTPPPCSSMPAIGGMSPWWMTLIGGDGAGGAWCCSPTTCAPAPGGAPPGSGAAPLPGAPVPQPPLPFRLLPVPLAAGLAGGFRGPGPGWTQHSAGGSGAGEACLSPTAAVPGGLDPYPGRPQASFAGWCRPITTPRFPAPRPELAALADRIEAREWAPDQGSWETLAGIDRTLVGLGVVPGESAEA